jgi:hypothetical protein
MSARSMIFCYSYMSYDSAVSKVSDWQQTGWPGFEPSKGVHVQNWSGIHSVY